MSTLQRSLLGLSGRLVTTALMVASTLLLARRLGPEGMGRYFLFLRVVALLAVFADLGFSQSTTVFAGRGESPRQLHGVVIRFAMSSSAVLILVFLVVMKLLGPAILPNYSWRLQVATVVALPFFVYACLWTYFMVGLSQIWRMNLVQVGAASATLLLVSVLVVGLSMGLPAAVAIYTGTLIVQALVMAAIAVSLGGGSSAGPRPRLFSDMLRFGLRAAGGNIATFFWQRIPMFVLNVFHGPAAVGVFSVGQQLVEKLLLPMQATQDAIYRRIAQLPAADARAAMNRYVRIGGWSMAIFLALAGVAMPGAVALVLGSKYAATVPAVIALLPGAAVMSAAFLLSTFFVAQLGKPGLLSIVATVAVGISLLLSAALIPAYGPIGAALAVSGTQVIAGATVVGLYLRNTGAAVVDLVKVSRRDLDLFRTQIRQVLPAGWPDA